jgi:hypothetical protein
MFHNLPSKLIGIKIPSKETEGSCSLLFETLKMILVSGRPLPDLKLAHPKTASAFSNFVAAMLLQIRRQYSCQPLSSMECEKRKHRCQ